MTSDWDQGPSPLVIIGIEEDRSYAAAQSSAARRLFGAPRTELAGPDAQLLWHELTDAQARGSTLTLTTADRTPAALGPVLAGETAGFVFHALAGRLHLSCDVTQAHDLARTLGSHGFTLLDAGGTGPIEPVLPSQVAVQSLRARLRDSFDPHRTFALGDRWVESAI
jgi:hypothetical protein